jgi:hypothetical protein
MRYEYAAAPGLSVSFQRYPYPASGSVGSLPDSRGALPLHETGPGWLLLPSPAEEAFWIGLIAEPTGPACHLHVVVSPASGDAITGAVVAWAGGGRLAVPPAHALTGVARGDGTWWTLSREPPGAVGPACRALDLLVRSAAFRRPSPKVHRGVRRWTLEPSSRGCCSGPPGKSRLRFRRLVADFPGGLRTGRPSRRARNAMLLSMVSSATGWPA